MASSSSLLHISTAIRYLSSASHNKLFNPKPFLVTFQQSHPSSRFSSILTFARRRNSSVPAAKKNKKQSSRHKHAGNEEDLDDDPFEALFQQLEEDLKNDDLPCDDDDDEITEEDLANLERELEEALGDDELVELFNSIDEELEEEVKDVKVRRSGSTIEVEAEVKDCEEEDEDEEEEVEEEEEEEEFEEDDEEEGVVELKRWQLKRLAYALKNGRRKTSIKNLAAELCLDRAYVLELLRDPPPDLLMLSATLPDKPLETISVPENANNFVKDAPSEIVVDETNKKATEKVPVHVMQRNWSAQKRLKKVHVETLERIYRRSKCPTNAMINNIVHVTNIPRKRVVKWFEDKRAEDGVPDHRLPYKRSTTDSVFAS